MADVILKNGKTLTYNNVTDMSAGEGVVRLGEGKFLIALIPLAVIERAEFVEPCKIYRPKKKGLKNKGKN